MSPVHLRNLGFQRNQPKDREGLSTTRRTGGGHLGHSGGFQNIEGNDTPSTIHIQIQEKPQTRGLEGYGSSSSDPPTHQTRFSMENGQQEAVQTPGGEGKQDKGESSHYPSYIGKADPDRAYADSFRLTRSRPNQLTCGFTPFRNQHISGRESQFFTIPGSFQEQKRIQVQKQDLLQPNAESVRLNDPEAFRLGERSTKELEIGVHTSRISSPINGNITPTQIEHNVASPESNLNSDALWLQMSQFTQKIQKKFSELQASHERMKSLTAAMDKIVKTLQEGNA
ncbi:hypothetical protein O181_018120 [Austropuccinia psidii MF-1]|uniref:Uncharacterized protein n=1 Tax=Austropuccinia psidii MF-1 TaxID=1389203 RepID=A0A9Q3GTQ3_9BASI|nr:hypothetical protein [Austropuccinia psidii MF-1]